MRARTTLTVRWSATYKSGSANSSPRLAIKPDVAGEEWPARDVNCKTLIGNSFLYSVSLYTTLYEVFANKENRERGALWRLSRYRRTLPSLSFLLSFYLSTLRSIIGKFRLIYVYISLAINHAMQFFWPRVAVRQLPFIHTRMQAGNLGLKVVHYSNV